MQLKSIKLLGAAGRTFVREIKLAVTSPAEAVRALSVLFPDFRAWVIQQAEQGVHWRVITHKGRSIDETELDRETDSDQIVFAPTIEGAGGGKNPFSSLWQVITGVALIAVSLFVPAAAFGLTSMFTVGLIGAGLVFNGVSQMLTPTPAVPQVRGSMPVGNTTGARYGGVEGSQTQQLESNLFTRGAGTGAQGECVPVLFGERIVEVPRRISFSLENLPKDRSIATAELNVTDMIGYVNKQDLT